MLKFLSKVVEYCPLDLWKAAAAELLAQCNGRKAKDSNPACSVELRYLPTPPLTEDPESRPPLPPPRVLVTYRRRGGHRRRGGRHRAGHPGPDPRPGPVHRHRADVPRRRGEVARPHPRGGARDVVPWHQGAAFHFPFCRTPCVRGCLLLLCVERYINSVSPCYLFSSVTLRHP